MEEINFESVTLHREVNCTHKCCTVSEELSAAVSLLPGCLAHIQADMAGGHLQLKP